MGWVFAPPDQAFVAAEALAPPQVAAPAAFDAPDGMHVAPQALGPQPPGAEAAAAQEDVARAQVIPERLEPRQFMLAPVAASPGSEPAGGQAEPEATIRIIGNPQPGFRTDCWG